MSGQGQRSSGLTLYEVVLSLSILLGSLATLGQLISTGTRAAVESRLKTRAILLCESKLAEVIAGVEAMQSTSGVPFDETAPNWSWSLAVAETGHVGLLELEVTVSRVGQGQASDSTFSIRRYVRDPQLLLDAAAESLEEGSGGG